MEGKALQVLSGLVGFFCLWRPLLDCWATCLWGFPGAALPSSSIQPRWGRSHESLKNPHNTPEAWLCISPWLTLVVVEEPGGGSWMRVGQMEGSPVKAEVPSGCSLVARALQCVCSESPFQGLSVCALLQKYRSPDACSPSPSASTQQSSPQAPSEGSAPELVHVSEKNLSQIENVHGLVSHAHISPVKVGESFSPSFVMCRPLCASFCPILLAQNNLPSVFLISEWSFTVL